MTYREYTSVPNFQSINQFFFSAFFSTYVFNAVNPVFPDLVVFTAKNKKKKKCIISMLSPFVVQRDGKVLFLTRLKCI